MPSLLVELGALFRTISDVIHHGSATTADWVAIIILGVFTLIGMSKGLSGIIIPFAALLMGIKLASDQSALDIAAQYTGLTSPLALGGIVLLVVLVAGMIARSIIRSFFRALFILWVADRMGGTTIGLVTACYLVSFSAEYVQNYLPSSLSTGISPSPVVEAADNFNRSLPFSGTLSALAKKTNEAAMPLVNQIPDGLKELPSLDIKKW